MTILIIRPTGQAVGLYTEDIALDRLGTVQLRRASHVEPDQAGRWWADLSPVGGPVLGSFDRRSQAIDAERTWLAARLESIDLALLEIHKPHNTI